MGPLIRKAVGSVCTLCRTCLSRTTRRQKFSTNSQIWSKGKGDSPIGQGRSVSHTWESTVSPFGRFVFSGSGPVTIKPVDPMTYPLMDHAFIHLQGNAEALSSNSVQAMYINRNPHLGALEVEDESEPQHPNTLTVTGPATDTSSKVNCIAEIPIKYELIVTPPDGSSVDIISMESDSVFLKLLNSACNMKSLKAADINIESNGGQILCKSVLQGNVRIHTVGHVPIRAEKLQSLKLDIQQEQADVDVAAVYGRESQIAVDTGNLRLGDCHGNMQIRVKEEGQVNIGSLDGNLTANVKKGSLSVLVMQHGQVQITVEQGDVELRLGSDNSTNLELEAKEIHVCDTLTVHDKNETTKDSLIHMTGYIGSSSETAMPDGSSKVVKASAPNGKIKVSQQDWFSGLKAFQNLRQG